jgi:hypothetical protein
MTRQKFMFISILIGLVVGGGVGFALHALYIGLGLGFLAGVLVGLTRNV